MGKKYPADGIKKSTAAVLYKKHAVTYHLLSPPFLKISTKKIEKVVLSIVCSG
jgi:hypothetical protein